MTDGRARGVIFDVGHGGGSFLWSCAIPLMKAGFIPDSISTDLHYSSMNAGMKDMLNVMDKFLAMGMSLDEVILRSTWNPAHEIQHDELGNLSVGSPADVAVLRLEKGKFGFTDQIGARFEGTQKLFRRADPARRQSRVRPERHDPRNVGQNSRGRTGRRSALGLLHVRGPQHECKSRGSEEAVVCV